MARKIRWTTEALTEQKKILTYYRQRNGNNEYSCKLRQLFHEVLLYVGRNPRIGQCTEYKQVRYVLAHPDYSIYYTYNTQEIIVLALWDNRRNPERIEEILGKA